MKRIFYTLLGCASVLGVSAQSTFTPGNIVVLQTSGTVSKQSSQAVLKEFSTSGAAGITAAIPVTGPTPFQVGGVFGGSEGFLTTSTDGKYLVVGGYATAASYTDITGTSATAVPRAVGLVYPSGFYLQFDTSRSFYNGNDIRGAVSDGTNFWASGASNNSVDGINYYGPGPHAALAAASTPPKAYGLRIFNGQVYYSTQKSGPVNSSSQLGIFALGTGLPTSGTVTVSQIINTGSTIALDFSFNPTGDVCYIAVNLNTAAGGIQKWTRSGSVWSLAYTLGTGVSNIGAYGIVVDYSGTFPVIYATTFESAGNRVIKITDNGAGATATTIVAATTNVFYKGISFAPVASGLPLVNISTNYDTASEAGMTVVTVTANASAPVSGDQTVSLAVSGAGITAGDYTLSGTTITIPNGHTSGSVTFTIVDDILGEGTETAVLTISGPSAGIALGMRTTQMVTIADNDGNNHPIVVLDTTTTDFIDTGAATETASPFSLSGVMSDPTDPASVSGVNFYINDLETDASALVVWATSGNTSVVPAGGLILSVTDSFANLRITPSAIGFSDITVKVTDGIDTTSFILHYAASAASVTPAATFWHTGMSDASDGIVIDDNYYISADDELNVLNVYAKDRSGMPLKSFNYTSFLSLPNPASPEADIEAAATSPAHPNRVYWMGSMSNGKSPFDNKPNRDRLFAFTYSGTGAATTFAFNGYTALRSAILAWGDANGYAFTASAAAGVDSKSPSGFAAEGMVFGPDNTTLYIGMRAPLVPTATRTNAVIVPILSFETWFNDGATSGSPTLGDPIELNLGGRGIRDMIRLPNGSYIILAGNPGGSPLTSAIYKWTGYAYDAPIMISTSIDGVLNIEGVLPVSASGTLSLTSLQVITDEGDDEFYGDGTVAKDFNILPYRKFRSDIVSGIDLTYPEINVTGNSIKITDGTSTASTANYSDFGNVPFGTTATRSFVVQNLGTADLNVTAVNFTGTDAIDFSLGTAPAFPLTIAAGTSYTVTVQYTAHALATGNATMNILSNDNDEATYDFAIRATGVCNTPVAYTVTGGGAYCAGGTGLPIGLSSSATDVDYQLYNGSTTVSSAVPGTGAALSFGTFTTAGTYSVLATAVASGCTNDMTGMPNIVINPLPAVYSVTGGGSYCAGGTGVHVGLGGSTAAISYELYNGSTLATTITGTGTPIDFGTFTTAGTYSVVARNSATSCSSDMMGSIAVVMTPTVMPTIAMSADMGTTVCEGTDVLFTTAITNGGSDPVYQWYVNSVATVAAASYSYTPATGDIVSVKLTSNAACAVPDTAVDMLTMTVNPNVTPGITIDVAPNDTVCAGTSITFMPVITYGGTAPVFSWLKNSSLAGTDTSFTFTPADGDGVILHMTSNYPCLTTSTVFSNAIHMTVLENYMPSVAITASPSTAIFPGTSVTITATATGAGPAPTYQWVKNTSEIAGATTASYTSSTLADGDSVTCVVTGTGACGLDSFNSIVMKVFPVGVNNVENNFHVAVVPNPNSGRFRITGNSRDKELSISVVNTLGQHIYTSPVQTINGELSKEVTLGDNIAAGTYILSVVGDNTQASFRIVVTR